MIITPQNLANGVNELIHRWQKVGLVSDSRHHKPFTRSNGLVEVSWGNDGYVLKNNDFATLEEYADLIDKRQYSALLSNGDFFQISFSLKRNKIVKHRLCWYPCPIQLQPEELETGSICDAMLDRLSSAKLQDFQSKGPVRFDYDSFSYSDEHPEIHLHIINENCRIPVRQPLCLRAFSDFIFRNFYSDNPELVKLNQEATTWNSPDRLTDAQRAIMHLNIFQQI